ncbi:hypothetical protein BLOT_001139 [Blomia tropicalis]|nr:hypothetical protein BLOT_001139 [Blomia tropicalis]
MSLLSADSSGPVQVVCVVGYKDDVFTSKVLIDVFQKRTLFSILYREHVGIGANFRILSIWKNV